MLPFVGCPSLKLLATVRCSTPKNYFCSVSEISPLDELIKNIGVRRRTQVIKSKRDEMKQNIVPQMQGAGKVLDKEKRKYLKPLAREAIPVKRVNPKRIQPHETSRPELAEKSYSVRENWFKTDNELSTHLRALLSKHENSYAFQLFQQGILQHTVPQFQILAVLAATAAASGKKQILDTVQSVARLIYPLEFDKQCGFQVCECELLWKSFQYDAACEMLKVLYISHSSQRRKIRNIYKYLVNHAISNHDKSEAQFASIESLAKNLAIDHEDNQLLATLWKCCIKSQWFNHQSVAFKIQDQAQENEELKYLLIRKLQSIMKEIHSDDSSVDLLQHLIQTALKLELSEELRFFLGKLLEYQCLTNRFQEADETLKLSKQLNVMLPFENCAVYALTLRKRKRFNPAMIPEELKQEPNIKQPSIYEFQF